MYVVQFGFLFTLFRLFRLDDPLEFVPFVEGRRKVCRSFKSMNRDNLNLMSISHQLSIIIKDAKISNNNIYKVTYLLLSNLNYY